MLCRRFCRCKGVFLEPEGIPLIDQGFVVTCGKVLAMMCNVGFNSVGGPPDVQGRIPRKTWQEQFLRKEVGLMSFTRPSFRHLCSGELNE